MKAVQASILLAILVGFASAVAAFQVNCPVNCSPLKKRICVKESKKGCCVYNYKERACVAWPSCTGLKQAGCKMDPSCLWSGHGKGRRWALDTNRQSRVGSCVDKPAGFDKNLCQYNVRRGCRKLFYCKWVINKNKKGGRCVNNGQPTGSPTQPTLAPTKSPTTTAPTISPTLQPTVAYAGTYTQNDDFVISAGSTGTKCGGAFFKENQSFDQCDTICNNCNACLGYNYEITGYTNAGAPNTKCSWKKVVSPLASSSGNYFFQKPS